MSAFYSDLYDTIAAISSPFGKGAISVLRISGSHTRQILKKIFRPVTKSGKILFPGVYTGDIVKNNTIIDNVLVLTFKKPKSYTGEDLAEIQCHGNPLITNMILNLLCYSGARMANPGEFTYRAVYNNKMDLIQAESINDLINARTYIATELSLKNLKGGLSHKIEGFYNELRQIRIELEVAIDHSEEDNSLINLEEIVMKIKKIINIISELIKTYEITKQIRSGINVSIIGMVNAGKSSLFNLLIKRDKAIISSIAGTTRDLVEEYIELAGYPIKLTDTAGLKIVGDDIEKEAIKRTYQAIKDSNILIVVIDISRNLNKRNYKFINQVLKNKAEKIVVLNKIDLEHKLDSRKISNLFNNNKIINISVSRETGIKKLESKLIENIKKYDIKKSIIITNLRHKNILINVKKNLINLIKSVENGLYYDIICVDLIKAMNELNILTGHYTTENLLNDIFSKFCIGK